MSWWDSLLRQLGWPEPPEPVASPAKVRTDQAAHHIARFTRALEQCTKGETRRAELQANLDYWTAIAEAEARLGAAK